MQAVISMIARGKGTFALRRDLKAAKDAVCELKRLKENEQGTHLQLDVTDDVTRSICVRKRPHFASRDRYLHAFCESNWSPQILTL